MNNKLKSLRVHTTQGLSGVLARESQTIFNYQTNERDCEIGLTMPLTAKSYASNILPGPLRQNLPEGFLRHWIGNFLHGHYFTPMLVLTDEFVF